jgi:hypothetical protein
MRIRANKLFISILLIGGPPLTRITASLVVFWGTSAALADEVVPSDEAAARVVFTSPADGDILKSPVLVQFALTGMDLASPDGGGNRATLCAVACLRSRGPSATMTLLSGGETIEL